MEIFLKATAGILITAIISVVLSRHGTDISLLLTLAVCSMVVIAAAVYLRPVLDFVRRLVQIGELSNELLNVLLKIVGIGLISQIAGFVCADAGNQSLGKTLQIITTAVILSISVPLFEQILSLIETVLGEV